MNEDRPAPPPPLVAPPPYPGQPQPKRSSAWIWIVVIGVCAVGLFVLLIIAAIAIPQMLRLKKAANQTSAIQSMRTIGSAELSYYASYPDAGYACSLGILGGDPASGSPSPQAAQLIDPSLASSGQKAGYTFSLSCINKQSYRLTAVPQTVGKTGDNGYCSDESNVIKVDPAGGNNCTEPLQ